MPAHDIELHQHVRTLNKVDLVFTVNNSEEGKLGELRISKGGLDWWPKSSKKQYHSCTWEQLRDFLESGTPKRSS